MERRQFVKSLLAAGLIAPRLQAQSAPDWGGPVLDTHLHLRRDADSCFTHMQGCGVTNAILLTSAADQDKAKQEMEHRPGRFARSVRTDPTLSGSDKVLRDALQGGAVSIGEMKFNVALDSPEMRRVYDIAAEMKVPVMMHIQWNPVVQASILVAVDVLRRLYQCREQAHHGPRLWSRAAGGSLPDELRRWL